MPQDINNKELTTNLTVPAQHSPWGRLKTGGVRLGLRVLRFNSTVLSASFEGTISLLLAYGKMFSWHVEPAGAPFFHMNEGLNTVKNIHLLNRF